MVTYRSPAFLIHKFNSASATESSVSLPLFIQFSNIWTHLPYIYLAPSGALRVGSKLDIVSPLSLFLSFDCWLIENNLSWCSSAAWGEAGTTRHLSSPLLSSLSLLQRLMNLRKVFMAWERIRVNRSVMQEGKQEAQVLFNLPLGSHCQHSIDPK